MNAFINGWAALVLKLRLMIIVLTVILMGLALIPASTIYYDNSSESYFVEGDANLVSFNRLVDRFGDNEYLSIGLDARPGEADIFTEQNIQTIAKITEFLEWHEAVTQVRSLSKYQYTHAEQVSPTDTDTALATDDLFEDPSAGLSLQQLAKAKAIVLNEQLILGSLITNDLQHVRIAARVEYIANQTDHKVKLLNDFYEFSKEQEFSKLGYNISLGGQPLFSERFETITKTDASWINPTMALVMIVLLYISLRSISGMLLPWLVIGSSIVFVSGIQGLFNWPHTVVESALVPTLIIIGIGISIHVIVEFFAFRSKGQSSQEAVTSMIQHLWKPAFFTALTTSIGFLALSVTELRPVKQFAYLGAIGPMIMFLMAMTLLPAVLSFTKGFSSRTQKVMQSGIISRLTQKVPDFTYKFRTPLVFMGITMLVFAAVNVPNLKVDTNFVSYFKEGHKVRTDTMYFNDHYKGAVNIDVVVDSKTDGGVKEPAFLRRVASLQADLEARADTGEINSLVDFIKQISKALNNDNAEFYKIPDSAQAVAQYLFLFENSGPEEDLSDAKDFDERYLRMSVPINNMAASDTQIALDEIKALISQKYPDLSIELTGGLVMFNAQDIYVNNGMVKSFSIALLIIAICFILLFRSVKYGLLALVPSVVPIIVAGGVLAVFNIPLNLGTMIVGAMTMGIAVDDAIHVMSRYLEAKKRGLSVHESITNAMTQSGRAVVFTSIILVLGFSVMLLGTFIPYIYIGLIAGIIMILALIGDLLVLPALLYWIDGSQEKRANKLLQNPTIAKV